MRNLDDLTSVLTACRGQGATSFLFENAPAGSLIIVGTKDQANALREDARARQVQVASIDTLGYFRGINPRLALIDTSAVFAIIEVFNRLAAEDTMRVSLPQSGLIDARRVTALISELLEFQRNGGQVVISS